MISGIFEVITVLLLVKIMLAVLLFVHVVFAMLKAGRTRRLHTLRLIPLRQDFRMGKTPMRIHSLLGSMESLILQRCAP